MQEISAVDTYMAMHRDKFPETEWETISEKLINCSDSQWNRIRFLDLKVPNNMLIISFFVGYWGVERFMLGRKGSGVLKLFVFHLSIIGETACIFLFIAGENGLGVFCLMLFLIGLSWWLIDLCLVRGMTKEYNYELINKMLQ